VSTATTAELPGASVSDPLLALSGVDVSYGSVQVLFGVDIAVRPGETLALLGTNGAGKSTALRALTGLTPPAAGTVTFWGEDITRVPTEERVRRGVVMVPGGKAVFPSMSVRDNLEVGAWTFVWDRALVAERIERVVELFPRIGDRMAQTAGTLSGGEQQQLAIAKALLLDPTVLIIDELSLGLSPVVVQDLLAVVDDLRARGLTMVLVEQSLNIALAISDRAVFMEKGQVRFEGATADLVGRDDLARAVFLGGGGG
jgi:ABC-type branched-subunit amino acid transport system ATPase component